MLPYFGEHYGNAASKTHSLGWTASAAVDLAREQVAELLGAQSNEIVFCSGATEANNLALRGVAHAYAERGKHIIVANTEHASVLDSARRLEGEGYELTLLPVESDGLLDPERLRAALRPETSLVSIMLANNEIGVVQDIAALSALVHAEDDAIVFHTDAAQALATIPMDVAQLGVDLLSVSAHKAYGPKGVGALWRRRRPRLKIIPIIEGGGHEDGLRSGTLPVPLIVGFGEACAIAKMEGDSDARRIEKLRDSMWHALQSKLPDLRLNGSLDARLCGNLNIAFAGVQAEQLVLALRDIACSTGAACSSALAKPSHVLEAIGSVENATESLRFGLGRFTTDAEAKEATSLIVSATESLRLR